LFLVFQREEKVVDIKFLESLIAVVEQGSIAAAAREQNLTATAVSQRIKSLEEQLNCKLLSRIGHNALPTESCMRILPRVKNMIADSVRLKADIAPQGLFGELKLGTIPTALTDYVPMLVKEFSTAAPTANLLITPGASAGLYDQLLEQKIDAALMIEPAFAVPKKFRMTEIAIEPLCLISNIKLRGSIAEILANHPLILFDRNTWGGKLTWQWLLEQNIEFNTLCEIDAFETMVAMVQTGLGVTILPKWRGLMLHKQISVQDIATARPQCRKIILLADRASPAQSLITLCHDKLLKFV